MRLSSAAKFLDLVASGRPVAQVAHDLENSAHATTWEGKVYCAVVLDGWSRRVAGWSIDSS